jgi:hypothetical protein
MYNWIVLTNATQGSDATFNDWYDDVHIPDLLRVPGIVSARRFELAPVQMTSEEGQMKVVSTGDASLDYRYLALYAIETDDLEAVLEEVRVRAGTSEMVLSPALGDAHTMCFELR